MKIHLFQPRSKGVLLCDMTPHFVASSWGILFADMRAGADTRGCRKRFHPMMQLLGFPTKRSGATFLCAISCGEGPTEYHQNVHCSVHCFVRICCIKLFHHDVPGSWDKNKLGSMSVLGGMVSGIDQAGPWPGAWEIWAAKPCKASFEALFHLKGSPSPMVYSP